MTDACRVPPAEVDLIVRLYNEDETIQRIACIVHRGTKTVARVLEEAGVPKRKPIGKSSIEFRPAGRESLGKIGLVGFNSPDRIAKYIALYGADRIEIRPKFTNHQLYTTGDTNA